MSRQLYARLAVTLFSIAIAQISLASTHSCPTALSTGQPACEASRDVGSNQPKLSSVRHVGNPIDVVSGNKYQHDLDIRLGGSNLSLSRHYNSQVKSNIGLGNGWRHTYSVFLFSNGDNARKITQSDSRVIDFIKVGDRFVSSDENDGYLLQNPDNSHRWVLPDGREFGFVGSYLTEIRFSDSDYLSLFYVDRRVHSVTDQNGRSIVFNYAQGDVSLPAYDFSENTTPAGHLMSIELPDGSEVKYAYDRYQNLAMVEYPVYGISTDGFRYRYDDQIDRTLLTERSTLTNRSLGRWEYDETGRAVSYRRGFQLKPWGEEASIPDVRLEYRAGASSSDGVTQATYKDGSVEEYQWRVDDEFRVTDLILVDSQASNINSGDREEQSESENDDQSNASSLADTNGSDEIYGYMGPAASLLIETLDSNGYPADVRFNTGDDSIDHTLRAHYSQKGKLKSVEWRSGIVPLIDASRVVQREFVKNYIQNKFVADGKQLDALEVVATIGALETAAEEFLDGSEVALVEGARITPRDVNRDRIGEALWSDGALKRNCPNGCTGTFESPQCTASTLTCDELREAMNYAELAQCAYADELCVSRHFEVNPTDLGITLDHMITGSFRADIYEDRLTGEYYVTFAGTADRGDWDDNIFQEFGRDAEQYQLAVDLARLLQRENPSATFHFTGHSLGGGLATAAAAAVQAQAFVFNPAALDPQSASSMGISYNDALNNTSVYSVQGELLRESFQLGLSFTNLPPGDVITLNRPGFNWISQNLARLGTIKYQFRLSLLLHGMDAVIQSISESMDRRQCS